MHGCTEESGLINMAIEQLFYSVEETPDRQFLMQVVRWNVVFSNSL